MKVSLDNGELLIPEYEHLGIILDCENCSYRNDCKYGSTCSPPESKYDCERFVNRISTVKLIIEILIFCTVSILSLVFFKGVLFTLLKIISTFIILLISDILTDKMIKSICISSEELRKEEYCIKVQKINEENEAIRRAKAGITDEVKNFLDNSKSLFDELTKSLSSIQNIINIENKDEKRVVDKFTEVLKELEILNSKLSKDNFENSYITTLYELHLPKLLEYSKQFITNFNSNTLTSKQIIEFSNLLEVFRVKVSKHTEYIQNKIEDDFIIKMQALNEDVIPDFDGNEVKKDE